jgi:hypothetical protein
MRKEKTILNENLFPIDDLFQSLFLIFDTNIINFINYKKKDEIEKKKYGLLTKKDELYNEIDITECLCDFLNFEIPENIFKFHYKNNSKTTEENRTTDIAIISKSYNQHLTICFVEAKRLPTPKYTGSQETEYVCYKKKTQQGGIERFKTGVHGGKEKLPFSIMIGYIQQENANHWHSKVNDWIGEQIKETSNENLEWFNEDLLSLDQNFENNEIITKYNSIHSRIELPKIKLKHYWITLN